MSITFTRVDDVPADADVLGVPVFAGEVSGPGAEFDEGFLAGRGFEAKPGETLAVPADDGSIIVAVGMGKQEKVDAEGLRRAAAALVKAAWKSKHVATTLLAAAPEGFDTALAAQAIAEGAALASYKFTRYKNEAKPCAVEAFSVVGYGSAVDTGLARGATIAEAVNTARDLVNTPAGDLTPSGLASLAEDIAFRGGLDVTVWDETDAANENLGGLLGVARGSDEPPRLIQLVYTPASTARATVAIVGKGITFDSGGLSLKPADGMETMKTDMGGAAAVLAVMSLLPTLAPDVKVIGIVPTTENMPSGKAIKPGDVLKIRNGKTVEVLNTDAEGRLILADGLSLATEAGVDAIIDLATLTGACMVALGNSIAGLMGNNDDWIGQVRAAADRAGERVWHLPLPEEYRKLIDSDVADIKNVAGRYGGALTAGLFLKEFVGETPWVHLDIAGPARSDSDEGYVPKGGTGVGVRTVVEAIAGFRKPS